MMREFDDNIPARAFDNFQASFHSYLDIILLYFGACIFLLIIGQCLIENQSVLLALQFVNFTEIMSKNMDRSRKEAEFALAALMEIPSQYKATLELNILG